VILLRHPRPRGGEGVCYGSTDLPVELPLAPSVAELSASLPTIERIVTSPLRRARAVAEPLAGLRRVPLHVDPRVRELDFGRWEGLDWDAVPRAELDAWASDLLHARPHGGESVAMLAVRVDQALAELGDGTLVITHMGVIRAALARAGHPDPWQARLEFGAWLTLRS
jgi:alpha-ribazole phosphatase